MSGYWRADVVLGPHSWSVESTDDPVAPGPVDGLRFGWTKPDDDPFGFAHPDHLQAKFGIYTSDPASLADVPEDAPVAIRVWFDAVTTDPALCKWSFYGRVSDIEAAPAPGGMIYAVDAVGYSVDLAEILSGLEAWTGGGADSAQTRAERIVADVGTIIGLDPYTGGIPLDRAAAPAAAWGLLLDHLKGSLAPRATAGLAAEFVYLALPVVHTYATDTGRGRGDGADWAVDYLDKYVHTDVAPLPAVFGLLPSGDYGITVEPDGDSGAIDACGIETASTKWLRSKSDRPTRVRLEASAYLPPPTAHVWTVDRPAPLVIESTYAVDMAYNVDDGQRVAEFLLPDQPAAAWAGDSYRFRLSDDPDGLPPLVPNFQDHTAPGSETRSALWARPLVVTDLPAQHDPIGRGYVAGQVIAAQLTITGGTVYVDFALNRNVPPVQPVADGYAPATPNYLSGADLSVAPYDAVTWTDLDPGLTGYDLRLARETD